MEYFGTRIVQMIFGSRMYGTHTDKSDQDMKGVFIPAPNQLLLQRVPNSINLGKKKGEGKNGPDDIDSEIYSLHHFLDLACKGETVALDMLHAPGSALLLNHEIWMNLKEQRSRFYTKNLKAFVGYARKQAAKYGVKGSRLETVKRVIDFFESQSPSTRLIDIWMDLPVGEHIHLTCGENPLYEVCGKKMTASSFCYHYLPMLYAYEKQYGERARLAETNEGIDWKAVSHAFRAAYQVRRILLDGGYSYPLPETPFIKKVKSGVLNYSQEVGPELDRLIEQVETLSKNSQLPEEADRAYWDEWLLNVLRRTL